MNDNLILAVNVSLSTLSWLASRVQQCLLVGCIYVITLHMDLVFWSGAKSIQHMFDERNAPKRRDAKRMLS